MALSADALRLASLSASGPGSLALAGYSGIPLEGILQNRGGATRLYTRLMLISFVAAIDTDEDTPGARYGVYEMTYVPSSGLVPNRNTKNLIPKLSR